jgi:hypothetical protein
MRFERWLIPGVIVLITAFHLATLRPGHEWGDSSLYVAHARNLAEGRPYGDTGYVYNPYYPSLSPRTYPPVFPLLLAPVYALFGLDLVPMKVLVVLLLGAFLGVLALLLRRRLDGLSVAGCLLVIGLSPYVWQHKDRLLSEVPFLLFAYLALYLMGRAFDPPGRLRPWAWAALAGLASYLAFGTRTVGVVLLPALAAYEVVRFRRIGVVTLAAGAVFAAGVLVQAALLPVDGSYLDQLVADPVVFARVGWSLARAMGSFFANGYSHDVTRALYLVLLLLAAAGFVARLRRSRLTPCEPFAVFSVVLVVLWPSSEWNLRYLLPVLPLFVAYACEGLRALPASWPRLRAGAAAAALLAMVASYGAAYTRAEWGPFREGVTAPETVALFEFVRTRTRPDDVFLFQEPRALALYTGRRASAHQVEPSDEHLWGYLRQIGATHLVVSPRCPASYAVLAPFVGRYADRLEEVFANEGYTVYRVREGPVASR